MLDVSLIISLIITSGVYITGCVDQRQIKKFGFHGSRFLILSYSLIYSFIHTLILLYFYNKYIIHDELGLLSSAFFVFIVLIYIGIVHTDTENTLIEYLYSKSPLAKLLLDLDNKEDGV